MKRTVTTLIMMAIVCATLTSNAFAQANEINLLGQATDQLAGGNTSWGNFLNTIQNSGTIVNATGANNTQQNQGTIQNQIAPVTANVGAGNNPFQAFIFSMFNMLGQILSGFGAANLGGAQVPLSFPQSVQQQFSSNGFMGMQQGNQSTPLSFPSSITNGSNQTTPAAPNSTPSADGGLPVPLYNQNNVGAGSNGGRYCGPTSVKMALEYYGIRHDVNTIGSAVMTPSSGASHQGMLDYVQGAGLTGSTMEYGVSLDWMKAQTDAGKPVLASVRGNYGPRSTNGHIVVVVGVTQTGNVIINDPAGGNRVEVDGATFMRANRGRMAISVSR